MKHFAALVNSTSAALAMEHKHAEENEYK